MSDEQNTIDRREAVRRVGLLLGGLTFVGGSSLLTACEKERKPVAAGASVGQFTADDIAYLDEIADTILPTTQKSPGAKAAKTGAFMALMVTDSYEPKDQQIFRDGMKKLDDASKQANGGKTFMEATPEQRLALLTQIDKDAKAYQDARDAAARQKPAANAADTAKKDTTKGGEQFLPDQRKEAAKAADANPAPAITADAPTHYFRMMKELAMLGFFTSEIGYTKAQRYVESPGRFDPCVPYTPGEKAWAPHA